MERTTTEILNLIEILQRELSQVATARFSPAKVQLACHNLAVALIPLQRPIQKLESER